MPTRFPIKLSLRCPECLQAEKVLIMSTSEPKILMCGKCIKPFTLEDAEQISQKQLSRG